MKENTQQSATLFLCITDSVLWPSTKPLTQHKVGFCLLAKQAFQFEKNVIIMADRYCIKVNINNLGIFFLGMTLKEQELNLTWGEVYQTYNRQQ